MSNDNDNTSAIKEAKQITISMQKIRKNMEIGVLQADIAINTLDQDGQTISSVLNEHQYELKSSLLQTKLKMNRVANLEKSEKFNGLVSIIFFTLCCFYIIAKRTRLLSIIYLSISTLLYGRDLLTNNTFNESITIDSSLSNINNEFINMDNINIDLETKKDKNIIEIIIKDSHLNNDINYMNIERNEIDINGNLFKNVDSEKNHVISEDNYDRIIGNENIEIVQFDMNEIIENEL